MSELNDSVETVKASRVVDKALKEKIYRRYLRAKVKVESGFVDLTGGGRRSTGVPRVYVAPFQKGPLVFEYRIGPDQVYGVISIGTKVMTIIRDYDGKQFRFDHTKAAV